MLSPKAREHGRETRVSITPKGNPNACAGQSTTRDFGKGSAQSRLVEQEEGPKLYAFHTLNLHTRACSQTIATEKRYETVRAHSLHTWKTLGIPQFLQPDNDAAFCGGYKAPRIFGQFVRLCLSLGIELIFLPIAQPEHNGEVEELNGLWAHAFWERRHFTSFAQVCRTNPAFVDWYMTEYIPPFLIDTTPQHAQAH